MAAVKWTKRRSAAVLAYTAAAVQDARPGLRAVDAYRRAFDILDDITEPQEALT